VYHVNRGGAYQMQGKPQHVFFSFPSPNAHKCLTYRRNYSVKSYFIAFTTWCCSCQRACNNRLPYARRSIGDALANAGESPATRWSVVRINILTTNSLRLSIQPSAAFIAGEDDSCKRPATTTWHLRCRMISRMSNSSGMVREPGNPTNRSLD
jgi:hypothetical protein